MTRLQILDFLFEHRRTEICLGSIFIRFTSIQYAFHEIKRCLRITWNTCKEKQKRKINIQKLEPKDFGIHHYRISVEVFFVSCQIGLRFELLDLQYAAQLGLLLMIFPIVCAKNETPIVYSGQSLVGITHKNPTLLYGSPTNWDFLVIIRSWKLQVKISRFRSCKL